MKNKVIIACTKRQKAIIINRREGEHNVDAADKEEVV